MNSNLSFIIGLYIGLLDRMPDPEGLKSWVAALDSGATTREHVVTSFFNSAEFQARSNSADLHEIVRDLYSNLFNRPADSAGLAGWTAQIDAGVQMDKIISGILSVVDDPKNADGQRLQNAIDATLSASAIFEKAGVPQFWVGTELDGITADAKSVAMFNYEVQQSVGVNAPAPAVVFDNVIKGDDFPGYTDINGTNLNDYIILGRNSQFAHGLGGDDQLIGTKNANTFFPGNGSDTVEAGSGNDIIDARNDLPATRRDVFFGQDGNDSIYGGASDEYIDGGDGDDLIDTGAGNDVVRGGIGNDKIIKSGAGEFNILGEAGDDTIIIDAASRGQIYGDAGNDTIVLNKATGWEVWAGSGNDVVTATSGNYSYAYMGDGNDKITLTGLHDITIYLGNGDDTVELNNCYNVKVYGGSGKDTFRVNNSTNLFFLGEKEQDTFIVDALSLKTGTVKLFGETDVIEYDSYGAIERTNEQTANTLVIESLNHGDMINFHQDNFRNVSHINLDYSQHAQITFDRILNLGLMEVTRGPFSLPDRANLWFNDKFGFTSETINSEIIFKYDGPFNSEGQSLFGAMRSGDWWAREFLTFEFSNNNDWVAHSNNWAYVKFNNLMSPVPLLGHVKVIDGALHVFGGTDS